MRSFYSLGVRLYSLAISAAAPFQEKAQKWKTGRKAYFRNLPTGLEGCIWIHCASLGEFEQGRPIIEALRGKTSKKLLLTFFSPSGYEIRKRYEGVDAVVYLPLDTKSNAKKFLNHFKPAAAIFIKYEVWHNFFHEMTRRGISHYIASAIFRKDQIYFKAYGAWFLKTLKEVDHIFCQDERSAKLLESKGLTNVSVTGDTRLDRVIKLAESFTPVDQVEKWLDDRKAIVAGSTWPEDETLFAELAKKLPDEVALIIAPHEIKTERIQKLSQKFKSADLFTLWNSDQAPSRVLIVDTIGVLGRLYHYGVAAYIGGGFGAGIHNTLEAAVYGIPVVFGPKYQKFREAVDLQKAGAAFSIQNKEGFDSIMNRLLEEDSFRRKAGEKGKNYVYKEGGATEKILKEIVN
jgi:3-deoxy-D-manno-octulosonic-acid transferase